MTRKSTEEKRARKSQYNKQWYLANRMYKKMYSRLDYQSKTSPLEIQSTYHDAISVIIFDRKRQIKAGRWIDERNGYPYIGIKKGL